MHSITLALIGTILVLLGVREGAGGGDKNVTWVRPRRHGLGRRLEA